MEVNCAVECVNGCKLGDACPNKEHLEDASKFIEDTSLDKMLEMARPQWSVVVWSGCRRRRLRRRSGCFQRMAFSREIYKSWAGVTLRVCRNGVRFECGRKLSLKGC